MIEEEDRGPEKMSKSLGNVYNLQDVVDHGFRPSALRYLYLGVHYRKQLKFSWAAMAQAEEALRRLTDFLARLDALPDAPPATGAATPAVAQRLEEARRAFADHIAADLNTAAAIGVMFDLVRALEYLDRCRRAGRRRRRGRARRRSSSSTGSSGSCRCAERRTNSRPCRSRRSSS